MEEKRSEWATPSMKEFIFWRDGMTPEEYEKELHHFYSMNSQGKWKEYRPLWQQKDN